MNRLIIISIWILFYHTLVYGQVQLQTIAEKSEFKSTANYHDVVSYIEILKKSSPFIRTETIATSFEGRDIPLLIIGNPLPESPKDLINDNRIVVYIQANIHAGEVEGKEASYHVEPVTFTWMVNPNGDNALIAYMRDKMMPVHINQKSGI
jgi:hypothetical protein